MVVASGPVYPFAARLFYVLLLLGGFAAMAAVAERNTPALEAIGLPRRPGVAAEWGLGAALGWGAVVACVLPVALLGGLVVSLRSHSASVITALAIDLLTLLAAALADELLFRGYPFQRLIDAIGPTFATLLMSLLFTLGRISFGASSSGSVVATMLLGVVLAMAYLRTRAIWVSWGLHFAWTATMAVLFGLPVGGLTDFAPVVSTYSSGPAWLTGGGDGPEGSAMAFAVLLVLLVILYRVTRELKYQWATPEIVGAGLAVDLDGASKRQHDAAMGPAAAVPEAPRLVQILPASHPAPLSPRAGGDSDPPDGLPK